MRAAERYHGEAKRIANVARNRGALTAAKLIVRTRRTYGVRAALVSALVMKDLAEQGNIDLIAAISYQLFNILESSNEGH